MILKPFSKRGCIVSLRISLRLQGLGLLLRRRRRSKDFKALCCARPPPLLGRPLSIGRGRGRSASAQRLRLRARSRSPAPSPVSTWASAIAKIADRAIPTARHVAAGQMRCATAWLSRAWAVQPAHRVAGLHRPRPHTSHRLAAAMAGAVGERLGARKQMAAGGAG